MSHDDVRSECDSVRCGELDADGLKCSLQVCQTCITKECPVDQAETSNNRYTCRTVYAEELCDCLVASDQVWVVERCGTA